jgi:hypothetical protein
MKLKSKENKRFLFAAPVLYSFPLPLTLSQGHDAVRQQPPRNGGLSHLA